MTAYPGRLVLLGRPVGHSLSPRMQDAALRAASIPLRYEPLDVARRELDDTIAMLRRVRGAGNVTIPYKQDVAARCDRLTPVARATGAVNTFWVAVDGALVGDNTDVEGFDRAIARMLPSRSGRRVLLLGAGGAAAAVLAAIKGWERPVISMYARTMERATELAEHIDIPLEAVADPAAAVATSDVVINATPVGMRDDELPIEPGLLPPRSVVFDLVYRPGETAFVRAARARGCLASDGLSMLVEQGALAFERWFGVVPDREAMWSSLPERR
jgi:shikimate dehydrogenase